MPLSDLHVMPPLCSPNTFPIHTFSIMTLITPFRNCSFTYLFSPLSHRSLENNWSTLLTFISIILAQCLEHTINIVFSQNILKKVKYQEIQAQMVIILGLSIPSVSYSGLCNLTATPCVHHCLYSQPLHFFIGPPCSLSCQLWENGAHITWPAGSASERTSGCQDFKNHEKSHTKKYFSLGDAQNSFRWGSKI